jgi:hypothetical protein
MVDMPVLHGVVLATAEPSAPYAAGTTDTWLWDGTLWRPLADAGFERCMAPSSAAWDPVNGQALLVASDQCQGGRTPIASQTWAFDGQVWRARGVAPDGVLWPALARDASTNRVAMVQAGSAGLREWSWTGNAWLLQGTPNRALPQPDQFAGAAFDAGVGGVVVVPTSAGVPLAYSARSGLWSTLSAVTFPQHIVAVAADSTDGKVLVLAQRPLPVNATPAPAAGDFHVLTWGGDRGWLWWGAEGWQAG